MAKKIYLLLVLCISHSLYAQEPDYQSDKTFTPTQLQRDFNILTSSLIDLHPSVYEFISEDSLASMIEEATTGLSQDMTEQEFHIIVRKFVRHIRCGHTTAKPSRAWYTLQLSDSKLLPFDVILLEDRIFIKAAYDQDSLLLPGLEILSIDDRPSTEIIQQMRLIQEVDGLTISYESHRVERLFRTYYLFLYGRSDAYTISYRDAQGAEQTIKVTAGLSAKTRKSSAKQPPILRMTGSKYELIEGSDKAALIRLASFNPKGYKKYYKSVFKDIQARQINHLVLDMRGNGGGYFLHGNRLLRYLLADTFSMDFSKSRKKVKKQSYLKMPISARWTKKLFSLIPDRDKEDPHRNYSIRYRPMKRNLYTGNLYVLTDGGSFSMGSLVATKLRYHRECTILGAETGGGEYGSNAVLMSTLTLPETQVRVSIPYYFLDHKVEVKKRGRGVIPDIEIERTLQDILTHRDRAMQQVRELIKQ